MKKKSKIRLNLGCGTDYKQGWINVDVSRKFRVDKIVNLNKLFPFKSNSIDEILAFDILEHFTKEKGQSFLLECHRVLVRGGIITLRTHNIEQIFKQFKDDKEVLIHFLYGDTKDSDIYGSHKYAYTDDSLAKLLKTFGFEILSLKKETTNFLVQAKKINRINSKVSIGIIQQSPGMGGAEEHMLSLIEKFRKKDHTVLVASNNSVFYKEARNLSGKSFEIPLILDFMGNLRGLIKSTLLLPYAFIFYSKLLNQFKKEKVDLILMSNFSEKLFVSFLSIFYKIPVIWIEYGPLDVIFKRNFHIPEILYRSLKNIPKKIIVPSKNTQKSLSKDAKVSFAKTEFIPCGVKIDAIKRSKRSLELRDKFIIGNASRLTREKGQEYLIDAMPDILKAIPNAYLLIIGGMGPDKEYFENLVKKLKIENNVEFTGYVNDPSKYYKMMDVFVFPTTWEIEGFGLVIAEAMAHRLPVIGTSSGPVVEIIDNEITGLIVPPKNAKAISGAIINLAGNKGKMKFFAQKGYKKAVEYYDINKIAEKYLNVFSESLI